MKQCLTLALVFFIFEASHAQISGFIKDQNGKAVAGAEVFINNSSWRVITEKDGAFLLNGLEPGFLDLVVYKSGFTIFKSAVRVQENKLYKLNLEISPETSKSSKIKPDKEWSNNLQWFTRGLLGAGEFANSCTIENPKSLLFQRSGPELTVTADEPIKIENASLGLQLNVYLLQFKGGVDSSSYQVLVNYVIKSSPDFTLQSTWERNRLKAYWGSTRHLFQSLVAKAVKHEGFILFDQNSPMDAANLVREGKIPGYFVIALEKETKIVFQMEPSVTGIKQEESTQVSYLKPKSTIEVNRNGILFNSQSVEIRGSMGSEKLASGLPIDYSPTSSLENEKVDWKNFSLLREKVYVQTDRDYYYPRETIWLKAYVGYSMPALRDTLSQTLYVELISPDKIRIDSKVYPIKEGVASGDFKLEETLPAGQYYLRAYTNWLLNYGDSTIFIKPLPILNVDENIEFSEGEFKNIASENISITLGTESFKARENVEVKIHVLDENGNPVKSNLSVSVTDAVASVPLSESKITDPQSLKVESFDTPNKYFDQITHFMERGISFQGVVKDAKNIPTPARLEIIQGNMDNLISMETDEHGEFLVTGVKFTDSLIFAFRPFNKKGKPLNRIDLLPREIPEMNFEIPVIPLRMRKEDAMQRIQNTYEATEKVTMLSEVEIKSSKLANDAIKQEVRIYGNPDYVVTGDNIRSTVAGTNFLVGLQGKVPGLRVIENADGEISVRVSRAGSFASSTEPLILVDGVPFPDARSISGLSPSMVDRVEVITRASPQYGSRGSNGVIAIYTKSGFSAQTSEKNFLDYKIPGYSRTRLFISPDYSTAKDIQTPDFRTTIFWKPDVKTDEAGNATVRFFTADLATRYRIVVEGVTDKGVPVRAVSYITVE